MGLDLGPLRWGLGTLLLGPLRDCQGHMRRIFVRGTLRGTTFWIELS